MFIVTALSSFKFNGSILIQRYNAVAVFGWVHNPEDEM